MLINMSLEKKIMNDIKSAMIAKNALKLDVLRAIKSEILLLKTSKGSSSLTEEKEILLLQKLLKQRSESQKIYDEKGRHDLAENEKSQANFIKSYLPNPYSSQEIELLVDSVIKELDAVSKKDMGRVMSVVMQRAKGRADGKTLSDCIKQKLN
tara:strand:- start:614 stop:1072 length:459 start_codon:yes stop_codon:yes gene_type:complete